MTQISKHIKRGTIINNRVDREGLLGKIMKQVVITIAIGQVRSIRLSVARGRLNISKDWVGRSRHRWCLDLKGREWSLVKVISLPLEILLKLMGPMDRVKRCIRRNFSLKQTMRRVRHPHLMWKIALRLVNRLKTAWNSKNLIIRPRCHLKWVNRTLRWRDSRRW